MTLKEWAEENGWDSAQIALRLDIHQSSVSRYLTGARLPSPRMIYEIQQLTKGKVMLADWVSP